MAEHLWEISRQIVERIIIEGKLVLETPTHLGGSKTFSLTDMPVLTDTLEGKALLPGASLAGALRNYLREIECGYSKKESSNGLASKLFGKLAKNDGTDSDGDQSYCIISDALGNPPLIEIRDGVKIDPKNRTAEDKKKFDLELLEAGTEFLVRFELLIPDGDTELVNALAEALRGLEEGRIRLGARKRRGYGLCKVTNWHVCRYDLRMPDGLLGYLDQNKNDQLKGDKITTLLSASPLSMDNREWFYMEAVFHVKDSMLIRSEIGDGKTPDSIHLHSRRMNKDVPIVSGTSMGGAIRHHALRIAKTMNNNSEIADDLVDEMFGPEIETSKKKAKASRVWVEESVIQKSAEIVQNRVKIDRFTGGSFTSALFNEQAIFAGTDTNINLTLELRNPRDEEIGLLLLILKDLWNNDLAIGGESSIGRGRLQGREANLTLHKHGIPVKKWRIVSDTNTNKMSIQGEKTDLELYVREFVRKMDGAK